MHSLRPWPRRSKLDKDLQGCVYRYASVCPSYKLDVEQVHSPHGGNCTEPTCSTGVLWLRLGHCKTLERWRQPLGQICPRNPTWPETA